MTSILSCSIILLALILVFQSTCKGVLGSDDRIIVVNMELDLNGSLHCGKIVVGDQSSAFDCNDLFFNDDPFVDTRSFEFIISDASIEETKSIPICLYDDYGTLITCTKPDVTLKDKPPEVTFHLGDNKTVVEYSTQKRETIKSEFNINAIVIDRAGVNCDDFITYVNHPKLIDYYQNTTAIDCTLENTFDSKQIHSISYIIPKDVIEEGEVFELCIELGHTRMCDLVQHLEKEIVIFDTT